MRKLDFLFIFLAVLISADYLTSVIGINWLEEQNQYVVAINDLIGNWFITFTLLFIIKLAALILLYKITTCSKLRQVRRSGINVAVVLLFVYAVIVVNNVVLIASAEIYEENGVIIEKGNFTLSQVSSKNYNAQYDTSSSCCFQIQQTTLL